MVLVGGRQRLLLSALVGEQHTAVLQILFFQAAARRRRGGLRCRARDGRSNLAVGDIAGHRIRPTITVAPPVPSVMGPPAIVMEVAEVAVKCARAEAEVAAAEAMTAVDPMTATEAMTAAVAAETAGRGVGCEEG